MFGVGVNDADYITNPMVKIEGKWVHLPVCPYYARWRDMLRRCYSKRYQEKQPTYKGCSVCEEWLLFSNFKKWMMAQEWQDRQLDKDFLIEGNKIYSPSTCLFVPSKVNSFITTCGKVQGEYPIGVSFSKANKKNPYQSRCSGDASVDRYLGYFPTPEQAHQAWLHKKLEVCNEYLAESKNEPLITKGLTRIKDKIQYHIENKLELTSF